MLVGMVLSNVPINHSLQSTAQLSYVFALSIPNILAINDIFLFYFLFSKQIKIIESF